MQFLHILISCDNGKGSVFVCACIFLISVQNMLIVVAGFKTNVRKPSTHSLSDESIFIDLIINVTVG